VPLVLLLLLALAALAHAAFLVSLEEEAASSASRAVVQARVMAEGGARRAIREARFDTLPYMGTGVLVLAEGRGRSGSFRVELRRLGPELYRVDGTGRAAPLHGAPERAEERASRVVWSMSPVERLRSLHAVLSHGGGAYVAPGALDLTGLTETDGFDSPVGCRDLTSSLDSIVTGEVFTDVASAQPASEGPLPELGLLGHDTLLARIPARAAAVVTPAPVAQDGLCVVGAPSNWGTPTDVLNPCAGHRPALASEGDVTLAGGEGQGMLLVAGDLRLTEGARYSGLVLVGGSLTLESGTLLEGTASVRGEVRAEAGSRVAGNLCAALLGLQAAPALRRPVNLPESGWIRGY
jgi:hypothetical protein